MKLFSIFLVLSFFAAESAICQQLGSMKSHQLVVENVHVYDEFDYVKPLSFIGGKSGLNVDPSTPEFVLHQYINLLANGRIEDALLLWMPTSRAFIEKKNESISKSDVVKNGRLLNLGRPIYFKKHIRYGDYVILEIGDRGDSLAITDSFYFRKHGGGWLLTQELADDPVACCRKEGGGRIRKIATPGGDFRLYMENIGRK